MSKENSKAQILVGCEGWGFDNWKTLRGGPTIFFPHRIRSNEKLPFYSKIFDTVEADNSYYGIPKASDFEKWYRQVPEHFRFSFKIPKGVTHVHNLSKSSFPIVEEFMERIAMLKSKAAVVLIQLPDTFKMARGMRSNLENFLNFLPDEFRFAIEFRSEEWFDPEIFALLKEHNTALCQGQDKFLSRETIAKSFEFPSADFSYFRFGGLRNLTKCDSIQRPQGEGIAFWVAQIKEAQSKGKDCFVYLSDFFEGLAPASAITFRKMLGQTFTLPDDLNNTPSLF